MQHFSTYGKMQWNPSPDKHRRWADVQLFPFPSSLRRPAAAV